MENLSIVIEGETLKHARMRALEEGTSVNEVVRDYLAYFSRHKGPKG